MPDSQNSKLKLQNFEQTYYLGVAYGFPQQNELSKDNGWGHSNFSHLIETNTSNKIPGVRKHGMVTNMER